MINIGRSVNIHSYDTFQKLNLSTNNLTVMTSSLMGFIDDSISPHGMWTYPSHFEMSHTPKHDNQIHGDRYPLDIQSNKRVTHVKQIKGGTIDLSYGDEVLDEDWHQRAKKQPKGVMLVLPYSDLSTKKGMIRGIAYRFLKFCQVLLAPRTDGITNQGTLGQSPSDRVVKVRVTFPKVKWVQLINFLWENAREFAWSPREC